MLVIINNDNNNANFNDANNAKRILKMIILLAYTQTHNSPITTAPTSTQLTTGNSPINYPGSL